MMVDAIIVPTPVSASTLRLLERQAPLTGFALGWIPLEDEGALREIIHQGCRRMDSVLPPPPATIGVVATGPAVIFWAVLQYLQERGYKSIIFQQRGRGSDDYYQLSWDELACL